MELIPKLKIGWLNGWIPLCLLYTVFGILLLTFPREVVRRLYDRSGWSRRQKIFTAVGKVFAFAYLCLMIFTPLKLGSGVLIVGSTVFALGLAGFIAALFSFKNTPLDHPVATGLYRVSRNPQILALVIAFLGISVAGGSWLAVLLLVGLQLLVHARILAEEGSCLQQYGDSYRSYMNRVPRYLWFL